MGSAAHIVVVEGGQWRHYGSTRMGYNFEHTVILGPRLAFAMLDQYPRWDREEWFQLCVCDAVALIDRDRSDLLVWQDDWLLKDNASGRSDLSVAALRAVLLRGLRRTWSGWTVRWASGGLLDVVTVIGVDPDAIEADAGGVPEPVEAVMPTAEELERASVCQLRLIDRDWGRWTAERIPRSLEEIRMSPDEARGWLGGRFDAGLTDAEYARLRGILAAGPASDRQRRPHPRNALDE